MIIGVRSLIQSLLIVICVRTLCAQAPLELTLKQAIDLALNPERNTRLMIAAESVRASEARLAESRAASQPLVDASVREQNQRVNLSAIGLQSVQIPVTGFAFPDGVGPFSTFDARASV